MARGMTQGNIPPPPRFQIRLGGHLDVDTIPAHRRRRLRPRRTMMRCDGVRHRDCFFYTVLGVDKREDVR